MSEAVKKIRSQTVKGRVESLEQILKEFAEHKLQQYNLKEFASVDINIHVPCKTVRDKHCSEHNDGYYCTYCLRVLRE